MYRWFLIGLAVVYAIAFISADLQLDSLYGAEGLIPKTYPDETYLLNALPQSKAGKSTMTTGSGNTNLIGALFTALQASFEHDKNWASYNWARALCNLGIFMRYPMVEWFHVLFRVNALVALSLALALGVGGRVVATRLGLKGRMPPLLFCGSFATAFMFALFWLSYAALVQFSGETFFHFQWDILLLELGFIGIVASLSPAESGLALFTIRVLAFKLLFLSGVVKIHSQCPTWLGLTAMDYHYATQCLPTPLAYFAHTWFSPFVQSFSVAATLVLQAVGSIFFLLPFPCSAAGLLHIGLQVMIALTGNYTFFNLAAGLMCYAVCVAPLHARPHQHFPERKTLTKKINQATNNLFSLVAVATVGGVLWYHFSYPEMKSLQAEAEKTSSSVLSTLLFSPNSGRLKPTFSIGDFNSVLHHTLQPWAVALMVASFVVIAVHDCWVMVSESFHQIHQMPIALIFVALRWVRFAIVALLCFCLLSFNTKTILDNTKPQGQPGPPHPVIAMVQPWISRSPLALVSQGLLQGTELQEPFKEIRETAKSSVHSYGLFRRMTGVGRKGEVARPEVILEGTYNGQDWFEFDFSYKPGNVSQPLPVVAPHQPRLDWQMWFAALSPQPPGWLIRLVQLLLQGKQLDIMAPRNQKALDLFANEVGQKRQRGGETRPTRLHSIRAWLYDYDFQKGATEVDGEPLSMKGKRKKDTKRDRNPDAWWTRSNRKEYLPAVNLQDQRLKSFIVQQKWDSASIKQRREFEKKHLDRAAISEAGVTMLSLTAVITILLVAFFV